MTDAIRAIDEVLRGLPDVAYESHYRTFEGLRLAHLDEGSEPPVWFMHGEPTWSFLWRTVFPPVLPATSCRKDRGAQIGERIAAWPRSDDVSRA
jgi:haloalkane dehalogenase